MLKKRTIFFLCVSLTLILLSSCSKSGKSKKEIAQDLQSNSFFQDDTDVKITEYNIIKRQTDVDSKSDIVYINVDAANEDFRWNRSYIMEYGLYNEGWILDNVTEYNSTEWKIWPLHGISEESLMNYIALNKSEYDFDNIEVIDRDTSLDENLGLDVITFKAVKEHILGTETLEFQETWFLNTDYYDFEAINSPQQLNRSIILGNSIVGTEWSDLARYDGTYDIFCDLISFKIDALNENGVIMSVTRKDVWAAYWDRLDYPSEFTTQIICSYLTYFDDDQLGFSLSDLNGILYDSKDEDNFDDNDYFIFDLDNSSKGKIISMGQTQIENALEKSVISGKSTEDEAIERVISIAQKRGMPCYDADNPICGIWNWDSDDSDFGNTIWCIWPDGAFEAYTKADDGYPLDRAEIGQLAYNGHWSYNKNYLSFSPSNGANVIWTGNDTFELDTEYSAYYYANRVKYNVDSKDNESNPIGAITFTPNPSIESNMPESNSNMPFIDEYKDILPAADGFTKLDISLPETYENGDKNFVTEVYQANNSTGYVFVVLGDGFGGKGTMKLIVSVDMSGNIIESRTLEESETQGLGSKVAANDFRSQFIGVNANTLDESVDCISGATISSNYYLNSIRSVFDTHRFITKN